jgi:hypothetical protein
LKAKPKTAKIKGTVVQDGFAGFIGEELGVVKSFRQGNDIRKKYIGYSKKNEMWDKCGLKRAVRRLLQTPQEGWEAPH